MFRKKVPITKGMTLASLYNLKRKIILAPLSYFIFVCNLFSPVVYAETFEQKLAVIQNTQDKDHSLVLIKSLLSSQDLTSLQLIALYNEQGLSSFSLGNLDNAVQSFSKIIDVSTAQQLHKNLADAQKMLGVMNYYQGNNQEALKAYKASLRYYDKIKKPIKHANLLNNIALVYGSMGEEILALEQYKAAEPLYQKYGTEADKNDVRHNIATLYLRLKRFDVAIDMFHEVIEKRKELQDFSGVAEVHGNLGTTYKQAGKNELAHKYLSQSLSYYQKIEDEYNSAGQLHNLAELYNQMGQADKAKENAQKSIELARTSGHKMALAGAFFSLAKAQLYFGEIEEAKENLALSDKAAFEMGYQNQLRENLALLALIYAANGENDKALSSHLAFIYENNKASGNALNEQLAKFEAKQLKQQVEHLQQQEKLQQLKLSQNTQQRNFIIIALVLLFSSAFFIYLRNNERRQKEELEKKVLQRTRDLEKANLVKGQFLANMSHEIRTPLTAIIGQAEAIVHGDVSDAYIVEEVEVIHENSVYLFALIDDILDLSKIEENKLEMDIHKHSIHQLLHELEQMFFERTTAKGLAFEITQQLPQHCEVEIDSLRVKQILFNLCSNAVKFTLEGKVSLDIQYINKALVFSVIDTGIGLDQEQIAKIFQSFTQGDNSIARQFGGSGLGLSLSDKLAKAMHGQIEVESQLNQGSTFTLTIPCELHECTQEPTTIEVSQSVVHGTLSGQILLAEDHIDNRRLISRLLTRMGLEVLAAENGREALELYDENEPELILLDIQMPEVDGIEAYNLLRERGCKKPIIAFTANAMKHERQQYLDMGFDGHLNKPIERKHFIETIAKYFPHDPSVMEKELSKVDVSDLTMQFTESLVQEYQKIEKAKHDENLALLSDTVHKLAGAAQMFGYPNLSTYALNVEMSIKRNEIEQLEELSQQLLDEIKKVITG